MDEIVEEFKNIKGFENKYKISNFGNVINENGQKLKTQNVKGYRRITLGSGENKKSFLVHRLVGEYFLENPNNYEEINHKDFNRSNNKVENLEWINHEDNIKYSVSNDRFKSKKKIKIKQYDLNGNLIKIWNSILDIKKELNLESISACCKGRRNTIGNFVWRYENDDFNKY